MDIIFGIFSGLVGLFIAYFLGLQFYKLGTSLKTRFPIVFRLYVIFWSLLGALVLIFALDGIKSAIDKNQREKRGDALTSLISPTPELYQDTLGRVKKAKRANVPDKEIFDAMILSSRYTSILKNANQAGYTYQEIAQHLGLYVDTNYQPPIETP